MRRAKRLNVKPGYCIEVEFEDGSGVTLDLSAELYGPVFEPLRDPSFFNQARMDEFGVICWPNGADFAPEFVWGEIRKKAAELSAP